MGAWSQAPEGQPVTLSRNNEWAVNAQGSLVRNPTTSRVVAAVEAPSHVLVEVLMLRAREEARDTLT